jgi:predicted N-acetyltransferase YhbS
MGIGRMLVNECLTAAKQAGFKQGEVFATPMSLPFFTALGFERQGETEITLPDGVSLPMTRLTKALT